MPSAAAPPGLDRSAPTLFGRAIRAFAHGHDGVAAPRWLLGVALLAGVVVAGVTVGHRPGLGVAVSAALVVAPALVQLVRRREWSGVVTAALGLACAGVVAVRAAEWVVLLCALAAAALCAVAVARARSPLGLVLALPTMAPAASRAVRWVSRSLAARVRERGGDTGRLLRTVLLTAVLLTVFTSLLASADAVFATLVPTADLALLARRLVVAAVAVLLVLGTVGVVARRPVWSRMRTRRPGVVEGAHWFVPVLGVGAVLVLFLLTQVVTAVGGDAYVMRTAGLTYAGYARAGFGQLVAVTALTLVVVAWFARRAPRTGRGAPRAVRASLALLCLGALGVVATALVRMHLYVQAYGLTELRLLATTGEIVMGVLLLAVLVAVIRWRGRGLPLAAVRVAGLAVLGLALLNPEAMIVRHNTRELEIPLDVFHLQRLSADAIPEIDALPEPLRTCLLDMHDATLPGVQDGDGVWGWNLARQRAAAVDPVEHGSCAGVG